MSSLLSRLAAALLALLLLISVFASAQDSPRFNDLGHHMICTCGCNQILLDCNHVGCTVSGTMRNELSAALSRNESDDLVLQGFVQKYGPTVLAAPTSSGFNLVAWIVPFAVAILGFLGAALLVRNWRLRPASTPALGNTAVVERYRNRVREETDI